MPCQTNRPLTVVSLLLGLFLAAMEMTVVSTAMPTAVVDLGGIHIYAWVFAAYMLTATVTLPINPSWRHAGRGRDHAKDRERDATVASAAVCPVEAHFLSTTQ